MIKKTRIKGSNRSVDIILSSPKTSIIKHVKEFHPHWWNFFCSCTWNIKKANPQKKKEGCGIYEEGLQRKIVFFKWYHQATDTKMHDDDTFWKIYLPQR